jgi:type VI secretion system protein ImpD/type VI secretion system protein ImpC
MQDVLPEIGEAHGDDEAPPPLRDAVLSGRFFGAQRAEASVELAAFLHERASAGDTLRAWFGAAQAQRLLAAPDAVRAALDRDIAAIDGLIGEQLDAILHHARLRRLEGSWRGVAWLVDSIAGAPRVRVKLLNLGWPELCRDLERAAEFDQSQLFRKVYEEEFGSPGGEPYGLLVVDHEVRHRPGPGAPTDDIAALSALSGVAAAAFAPTVLAASPALLQLDGFAELAPTADLAAPLAGAEYQRWRSLAGREDSRFLAVLLPRLLARAPWRDDPARREGFTYAEYAPEAGSRVWMSAGYAFAVAAARAFVNHAWPADVRGSDTDRLGGGLVVDVPLEPFTTEPAEVWSRPFLDVVFSDRQERALIDAGLIPVSALPFSEAAVFGAVRSLQSPAQFAGPTAAAASANARISTQLNSMLCVSRFAHYLKLLGREMVGAFRTADEIERALQAWIVPYVDSNAASTGDTRARFPLVAARVAVKERPGKPGVFSCTMHLQPHFQLDDVSASFRLVTDITAPGVRQ